MASCHTNCIEKPICVGLKKLGRFVGTYPWCFFILPLFISAALGGGFYFLRNREANGIEDQFTPVDGPAKKERLFVQENFPQKGSSFSSQRLYTEGIFGSVIASCEDGNILTEEALKELIDLNDRVRQMRVNVGQEEFTYYDVCATANQTCFSNSILDAIDYNATSIEHTNFTYPTCPSKSGVFFLGTTVGGVEWLRNSSVIQSARAIRLFYYLREDDEQKTNLWLNEFIKFLPNASMSTITHVSYFTSLSRQQEFERNSKTVIPLFSITYFLAISFSVVSCSRLDSVRNKVWVAIFGVISAGLAVLSSFGMLLYLGQPFVMTVATCPFLILGIGVDDMFIMISCWQQTNVHDKVEDRLAATYKEAAVSITVTTVTDILAFYIGVMTPFRSVKSFCLYTGTAVLFCYVYSITFLGAALALNGRREASNKHWLSCTEIPSEGSEGSEGRSKPYQICCTGGAYDKETNTEEAQAVSCFFKKHYGPFLTKPWTKVAVISVYIGYLAVSMYGCFQMREGIDLRHLASDHSYTVDYYNDEDKYFSGYGPNVMVVVKDDAFPYWNESQLVDLNMCMEEFQTLTFVDERVFTSWLAEYISYLNKSNINLNNETVFKKNLSSFLKVFPAFEQDLNFTKGEISASRFFIQTVNITSTYDEKHLLSRLREAAGRCPIPLLVYHPSFIYYDQYAVILRNTIQNVVVATAVMLVISLLLIPSPLCSLWVTFAIASVIVGVAGFMALWDVSLDSISMINLVICIGFSVDFSAHISYAFVSNGRPSASERAADALSTLGYPIVQGAVSTLLGVVVLSAASSYIFRTFFKIMFLVISLGAVHGLIFIPVFLTFFGLCSR